MADFLKFDLSEFQLLAKHMNIAEKQVPYAASKTINNAAFKAREYLINDTWPRSVVVRNKGFLRQALHVETASKTNLTAAVVDTLHRGNLWAHAHGGTKNARKKNIAIPTALVTRTSKGVRRNQRPANLGRSFVKNGILYQVVGHGKGQKIRPMYVLRKSAKIKKSVPFDEDFKKIARDTIRRTAAKELLKAMFGSYGRILK